MDKVTKEQSVIQQRRELLQEQLLKYQEFDIDGKLKKIDFYCSASVHWSGEVGVDHLNITKEDIERGLTEQQCNSLWDAYTEETLQDEGYEQCYMDLDILYGSEQVDVECVLLDTQGITTTNK